MSEARVRVFAGPNGSGKSTLFDSIPAKYKTGIFLNADLIEKEFETKGFIDLLDYNLNLNQNDLNKFLKTDRAVSLLQKSAEDDHHISIQLIENIIINRKNDSHSYEGALVSLFLRFHLQKLKIDFSFETVMSHHSKIDEIKELRQIGYKTYLYFICTDDPLVNISRVNNRVEKGGHNVSSGKISTRYYSTLKNLITMIENVDRCYFFDNSSEEFKLIAKISKNELSLETEPNFLPNWFLEYVVKYYL